MLFVLVSIFSIIFIFTDVYETYTFEKEICFFGYEKICEIKRNYKKITNNKPKLSFISQIIDYVINFCINYGSEIPYYVFNMFRNAFGLYNDEPRKKIMSIINISKKTLKKIQSIYGKLFKYIPSFEKNKIFANIFLSFYFMFLSFNIFNSLLIFINPSNFIINIIIQNIMLLLCLIFYNGKDNFVYLFFNEENIVIGTIFIFSILLAIALPRKYMISIFSIFMLLLSNILIFLLKMDSNLNI